MAKSTSPSSAAKKAATKIAAKPARTVEPTPVKLLSGGNPQIPKGYGDDVVKAYLQAIPDWKREVSVRLDALPTGPFDATLQLFGNFGDTLFCTWEFPGLTLCPPLACVPAEIYLTNTGELNAFQAFWWVTNTVDGTQVASGSFAMNDVDATQFDSLCLPPGDYVLEFTPFSPIDETYIMGITPNAQFTPGVDGTMQQDNTPLDLAFSWYDACTDGTNGLRELDVDPPLVMVDNGLLRLSDPQGRALGEISLWSSDGRLITMRTVNTDYAEFPLNGLAPGTILVRSVAPDGHIFTQRILTL